MISSQAERHCELGIQAANAGLHVIVDKPMSPSLQDCDHLVDAVKRNKVKSLVWNRNFLPALVHAREALELSESFAGLINHELIILELSACLRSCGNFEPAAEAFDKALASIEDRRARTSEDNWREAHGTKTSESLVNAATIKLDHPSDLSLVERQIAFYDVLRTHKARTLVERIHSWDGPEVFRGYIPLPQIQDEMLLPGDLVLEFSVSRKKSWLFATTPDQFRMVELPGALTGLQSHLMFAG